MAISFTGLSKRVRLTEDDVRVLELIAQGYPVKGEEDRFILVENPKYRPDNGANPYLVLNLPRIFQMNELFPKDNDDVEILEVQ